VLTPDYDSYLCDSPARSHNQHGYRMRITLALLLAAGTLIAAGWGQQATSEPNLRNLLVKLSSSKDQERWQAFETLRSNPANLKNPEVHAELINLLDRENRYLDSQLEEAQKKGYPDEGDNEAWAEYYSDLLTTVDSSADWNDPRQACILADAAYNDGSAFAAEVVSHSRTTMPCLLRKSQSPISMDRAATVPVLAEALARAKDTIDPGVTKTAKRVILRALRDPDDGVRASTVVALGSYGDKDMIPALKEVATTDPSPESQGHSIRKSAAEAILEIQKRAGQQ
jgi:HEAT repeat protein